ncbi:MAG: hypothetical protein LBM96_01870 [Methanobrevibacter sp.]|jgi:TM2 domain-containing membrane protein YozV|nr:hypothetical protein [Candidatus Methanoflexus mossambicus]
MGFWEERERKKKYAETLRKQEAKRKEIRNKKKNGKLERNGQYHKNVAIATLLSFFIVGLGQMYNGQILKGAIFFTIYYMVIFNLMFIVLQQLWLTLIIFLLIWIYNIYDAYKNAKNINTHNGNYFYNENLKISG